MAGMGTATDNFNRVLANHYNFMQLCFENWARHCLVNEEWVETGAERLQLSGDIGQALARLQSMASLKAVQLLPVAEFSMLLRAALGSPEAMKEWRHTLSTRDPRVFACRSHPTAEMRIGAFGTVAEKGPMPLILAARAWHFLGEREKEQVSLYMQTMTELAEVALSDFASASSGAMDPALMARAAAGDMGALEQMANGVNVDAFEDMIPETEEDAIVLIKQLCSNATPPMQEFMTQVLRKMHEAGVNVRHPDIPEEVIEMLEPYYKAAGVPGIDEDDSIMGQARRERTALEAQLRARVEAKRAARKNKGKRPLAE